MAVWINEFHYDDAGADTGEFVEIAGTAGTNLSGYSIVLYNGSGGASYGTFALGGTIPNQQNGFGTVSVATAGIQNGFPDGLALVGPGNVVVEFLSYEGTFVATDGPAAGLTSTDVGIVEPGDAEGTSIGRTGSGSQASSFAFTLNADDTPGAVNNGQSFPVIPPQLSVNDTMASEYYFLGTSYAFFTVTRTGGQDAFTVDVVTSNGTATAGSDYVASNGTLEFAAGQTSATVLVQIVDDELPEPPETFFLNLLNPTGGAVIVDGQGQATIDASDPGMVIYSVNSVAMNEGATGTTPFVFTVTRTGNPRAFTLNYSTSGASAREGEDFNPVSGTLNFAEGQNTQTFTVDVIGDRIAEGDEIFSVFVGGANVFAEPSYLGGSGTGTIVNDDLSFIHDIQGSAYFSPFLTDENKSFNQASTRTFLIQAVVTALDDVGARQGFYLTEERDQWDASSGTSEGIFVMTRNDSNVGTTLAVAAPGLKVGDLVTVRAQVMEYQAFATQARTILVNPSEITVNASGLTVPTLVLDAGRPIPNGILTSVTPDYRDPIDDAGDTFDAQNYALSYFETVEGMLVTVPDMVVADGFVSLSGGQPFLKAYSTVHADPNQINSRGGYTIAGDPPLSPPDTPATDDTVNSGGRYLHDGDVNPDIFEVDFSDFAIDAPAGLAGRATMGDRLGSVTGIVDFDFTDLKLFVTAIDPAAITNTVPVRESTALGRETGDGILGSRNLTVGTFNVQNLDPGDGAARFQAIARAIVGELGQPDIISIEEIQDNNGAATGGVTVNGVTLSATDASLTWTMLVDALNAQNTSARYQWVDQEPVSNAEGGEQSGNIRVGFLYNTRRVQLGDLAADAPIEQRRAFTDRIGDAVRDAGDRILYSDDMLGAEINTADWANTRKSLLGQFTFNGNTVFVAGNHLPSKGGSGEFWQYNQDLAAGQPANAGWSQRAAIGQDIYSMLNLVQANSPKAGIVSGGDYNDFYFYRPLEAATGYVYADGTARNDGAKFDNLTVSKLSEAERYTYTFDGRSQAIDHILVNGLLSGVASYDVVHINTGYNVRGTGADASPALSDHDPAIASFAFGDLGETLVGSGTINGFGGDDTIYGLGRDDELFGGAGNDGIDGGAGNDLIDGGDGDDRLYGNLGDDRIFGSGGADLLVGNGGMDVMDGGAGNDVIDGGEDSDRLYGNDGEDRLFGAAGNDLLDGGAGNDVMDGGDGSDSLYGNEGDDTLFGGAGNDTLVGNIGNDAMDGGANEDVLDGGDGEDRLYGGEGADLLFGGAGADLLVGNSGNDRMDGGVGDDVLDGGEDSDELYGNDGNDTLYGASGNDLLVGNDGNDVLDGGANEDVLDGGNGDDRLYGNDGSDRLFGGAGADLLDGGAGNDALDGGAGNDMLYGGDGSDALYGNDGDDMLYGGDGNDTLVGNSGNDVLDGGSGSNMLDGGDGDDVFYISSGQDVVVGGAGYDVVVLRFNGAILSGPEEGGMYFQDQDTGARVRVVDAESVRRGSVDGPVIFGGAGPPAASAARLVEAMGSFGATSAAEMREPDAEQPGLRDVAAPTSRTFAAAAF